MNKNLVSVLVIVVLLVAGGYLVYDKATNRESFSFDERIAPKPFMNGGVDYEPMRKSANMCDDSTMISAGNTVSVDYGSPPPSDGCPCLEFLYVY